MAATLGQCDLIGRGPDLEWPTKIRIVAPRIGLSRRLGDTLTPLVSRRRDEGVVGSQSIAVVTPPFGKGCAARRVPRISHDQITPWTSR